MKQAWISPRAGAKIPPHPKEHPLASTHVLSFMAQSLPVRLLKDQASVWRQARAGDVGWRDLVSLSAFIIFACALYGAVLAGWRSPLLSVYVAVKLPLLFLFTTGVVSVFNWMTSQLLGAGLSFKQTVFLVFSAMAMTSWILLALVPVALFFLYSGVQYVGTEAELRFAHNCLLITHISILAAAGVAGNWALLKGLRVLVSPSCAPGKLFVTWVTTFSFVGCQMSWIMRPFVGSPFFPVEFMRQDFLDRNFYEFIFTDVLPYLLTGGK
ncbi:hypothetical protein JYT83_00685 [bacterium AH-315-F18]|nr:hypothetical protein [bacterium AH-315-F18]